VLCLRRILGWLALVVLFASCETTPPYVYHYVPGRTATAQLGYAVAPDRAPPAVHEAIAAGNEIAGRPYRYGGGHASFDDSAYDCSGATSYVLHAIGRLHTPNPSGEFRKYGERGPGDWITVYAANGHVFLVIAGLRFDTGWGNGGEGPHWTTRSRPADGYVLRHPQGL
jgi:cell wall-associated NlpC family hydrolase